jgi:hypothetical protein
MNTSSNNTTWMSCVAQSDLFSKFLKGSLDAESDDSLSVRQYLNTTEWRAKEIPDAGFTPDLSIPIDGELVKQIVMSQFPRSVEIGGGKLDVSKAKSQYIRLGSKKNDVCKYTQHNLDIAFVSMKEKDHRIIVSWNGTIWELDSLGINVVPELVIGNNGIIRLDCNVEINWIQNFDWSGHILTAALEYSRSTINPALPHPLLSVNLPNINGLPDSRPISKTAVRIEGCFYPPEPDQPVSQTVYLDFKF